METKKERKINFQFLMEKMPIDELAKEYGYKEIEVDANETLFNSRFDKPMILTGVYYNEKTGDKIFTTCYKDITGVGNSYINLNNTKDKGSPLEFLEGRPEITGGSVIDFLEKRFGDAVFNPNFIVTYLYKC